MHRLSQSCLKRSGINIRGTNINKLDFELLRLSVEARSSFILVISIYFLCSELSTLFQVFRFMHRMINVNTTVYSIFCRKTEDLFTLLTG